MGVCSNCLPKDLYDELVKTRLPWETIAGDKKGENNVRADFSASQAYNEPGISEIWKDFLDYHTSASFYNQILKKFGGFFLQYYPAVDFSKFKVAPRFTTMEGDIYLDCQMGINTPVTERGTVSKPHLDNPNSVWAALLYMKEPDDNAGGHFRVFKCRDLPIDKGERQIDERGLIENAKIFYNPNTMVCFMNSPFSVHSVTDREVTDKPRLLVNFTLELKDKNFFSLERLQCQQ